MISQDHQGEAARLHNRKLEMVADCQGRTLVLGELTVPPHPITNAKTAKCQVLEARVTA